MWLFLFLPFSAQCLKELWYMRLHTRRIPDCTRKSQVIFVFNCGSLVKTQVKHSVLPHHHLTGGDFKATLVSHAPANLQTNHQCVCHPTSGTRPVHSTWASSLVSYHPNLARAHVQSSVSFCLFCRLPSGNSITNVSNLVSVNGSYIKKPLKMPHDCLYAILYIAYGWTFFFNLFFLQASQIVVSYLQPLHLRKLLYWFSCGELDEKTDTILGHTCQVRS